MDSQLERERERDGHINIERQIDKVSCLESPTMHFDSNDFEFGWLFVLMGILFVKKRKKNWRKILLVLIKPNHFQGESPKIKVA